jgi:group I intron endonuclease
MNSSIKIDNNSGIYSIINLINNKIYIGSAINFISRKKIHISFLRNNKHHSSKLQRAYNKYGEENFSFDLIEIVENKLDLIKREQVWIDFLNPEYNICRIAGSRIGSKCSEETKKKICLSTVGDKNGMYGKKHSEESKNKMRLVALNMSEETKRLIANYQIGKKHSQHRIDKSSKSRTGQKRSQETKAKLSKSLKGRIFSDLHKENISKSHKGLQISEKNPFAKTIINLQTGIFYGCVKDAWDSYRLESLSYFTTKLRNSRINNTPFIHAN